MFDNEVNIDVDMEKWHHAQLYLFTRRPAFTVVFSLSLREIFPEKYGLDLWQKNNFCHWATKTERGFVVVVGVAISPNNGRATVSVETLPWQWERTLLMEVAKKGKRESDRNQWLPAYWYNPVLYSAFLILLRSQWIALDPDQATDSNHGFQFFLIRL